MKSWKYHFIGKSFPFVIKFLEKQKSENIEVQKEFMRVDYLRCNLMIEYYNQKDGNYDYEIRMHTDRMDILLKDKPEWLI